VRARVRRTRKLLVQSRVPASLRVAARAFRADPGDWLPLPARRRGLGSWTVALHAAPLARTVSCAVGDPWVVGNGTWRSVQWRPEPQLRDALPVERGLPTFAGELGLLDDDGTPYVVLRGRYRIPGGAWGRPLDLLLAPVARHTAARFAADVAGRLAPAREPALT
jgi:hypothetical protein